MTCWEKLIFDNIYKILEMKTTETIHVYIYSSCQKTTYNKVKSLNNKSYNHVPESPKTILPSDSIVTFDFTCAEKM